MFVALRTSFKLYEPQLIGRRTRSEKGSGLAPVPSLLNEGKYLGSGPSLLCPFRLLFTVGINFLFGQFSEFLR